MIGADDLRRRCEEFYVACNTGDVELIMEHLAADAVHYFPEGSSLEILRSGRAIAEAWNRAVGEHGSQWTLDSLIVDADRREAALEWTHYKTRYGGHVRGAEFYLFDDDAKIVELRPYYAVSAPEASRRYDLHLFDYAGRGYSIEPARVPGTNA